VTPIAYTKVLLDANTVINAALLPNSFSAIALRLAKAQGKHEFLVSTGIMQEVKSTLERLAKNELKQIMAKSRVRALLDLLAATNVGESSGVQVPHSIPKHDAHVFQAAHAFEAIVLTSDAKFWLGLRECGMLGLLPLQWISQIDGMALQTTIFGITPTRHAGSLFVRAYPGNWAGTKVGQYVVLNLSRALKIHYEAKTASWVAEVAGLSRPLKQKIPISDSSLQTISLSWESTRSEPTIELRVSGIEHPDSIPLPDALSFSLAGHTSIGSNSSATNFWNGHIFICVSNDRPISSKAWKNYLCDRELAPNPFDADRAQKAVQSLKPNFSVPHQFA
jgi:predicted nucleic acid-binding protein